MSVATPGFVVWLTGIPSSGKTTLGHLLCERLRAEQRVVQMLDSDELRRVLTPTPTYSPAERDWFYSVLTYLAAMLAKNGVNVVVAATAARRRYRDNARAHLSRFAEVHVQCPVSVCRQRDPKGLWQKVQSGAITGLPGADEPYEAPYAPEATVDTSQIEAFEAIDLLYRQLDSAGIFDA